jgi:hypothetical protein
LNLHLDDSPVEEWKDMEDTVLSEIEIDTIDLADLFELHRIIEGCSHKLVPYLQKLAETDPSKDVRGIIELITSLGSPPKKTKRQVRRGKKRVKLLIKLFRRQE